jgi:hypothetical protein
MGHMAAPSNTHRTITIDEYGTLGCTCGEEHGPSLREELDWALDRIKSLETELAVVRADRDARCQLLGLALRRLLHLRKAGAR